MTLRNVVARTLAARPHPCSSIMNNAAAAAATATPRRQPAARFNAQLPWLAYTLVTLDGCQRTDIYQMQAGSLCCFDGDWQPSLPYQETSDVSLELHDGAGRLCEAMDIPAETHRDLEMEGELESFVERVLALGDLAAAAATWPAAA